VSIKHAFTNPKSDSADTTITQPSHWNADHIGAALVLLEQHTASSSATLDFTTCISSTYDSYLIELVALKTSGSALLNLLMSTDGGSNWDTTAAHYAWEMQAVTHSGWGYPYSTGDTKIQLNNYLGTGRMDGQLHLYTSDTRPSLTGQLNQEYTDYPNTAVFIFACYLGSSAVTALRFIPASGNITSGTIRVYGLAKA
jgi:hypothetical protein